MLTPPDELWKWLHKEAMRRNKEGEETWRHLATLRWLVLAELDRTAPEPAPPTPDFTTPHEPEY